MKIIKSMKKLKFWSRKKRKKKSNYDPYTNYLYPPPSTYRHHGCSCSSSSNQPSAPPLPPWLEYDQTHNAVFATASVHHGPDLDYAAEPQFSLPEIVVETTSVIPALPVGDNSSHSYQQYMVPNPVYELPVVQRTTRRERFSGFFGCVVKFGANLIRCLCPCFRIREGYA